MGAVVGSNAVHATEPVPLEEIVVTASRPPLIQITITITLNTTTDQSLLTASTATQLASFAAGAHAWSCANAYGGHTPGAVPGSPGAIAGPRPGTIDSGPYQTYFSNNYGWGNGNPNTQPVTWTTTSATATPPPGVGVVWGRIDGFTSPQMTSNIYVGGYTVIYVPTANVAKNGYSANANLIDTLAHEWSHEWGSSDIATNPSYNAYTIGHAARDAYLAEHGAKCGGL
jgi:hypothetical protein